MACRRALTWIFMAALLALAGCGDGHDGRRSSGKPLVVVSVPPHAWLVQRIAGDRVDVEVLVEPGQDPHTFSPSAQQVVRLERSAALFRTGMPFEDALVTRLAANRPEMRVVDTNRDLSAQEALTEPAHAHHDEYEDHARDEHAGAGTAGTAGDRHLFPHKDAEQGASPLEELDPHTWMSPRLAARQAGVIAETLAEIDPAGAEQYRRNLANLREELAALDVRIAVMLQPVRGRTFYVFHPAFGYFARAYGLTQRAVEHEGKPPGPRQLGELVEQARADGVRTIFVQRQFSDRAARAVARQIGAEVVGLDDMSPDYPANMLDVADKIRQALIVQRDGDATAGTAGDRP